MSAPLSSNYSSGFAAGRPLLYIVRLYPNGAAAPIYMTNLQEPIVNIGLPRGITYDGAYLAEIDINRQYLAAEINGSEVNDVDEIDFTFQMVDGGGMAARNECTIRLLNQGL